MRTASDPAPGLGGPPVPAGFLKFLHELHKPPQGDKALAGAESIELDGPSRGASGDWPCGPAVRQGRNERQQSGLAIDLPDHLRQGTDPGPSDATIGAFRRRP